VVAFVVCAFLFFFFLFFVLRVLFCVVSVWPFFTGSFHKKCFVAVYSSYYPLYTLSSNKLAFLNYLMVLLYLLFLSQIGLCLCCGLVSDFTVLGLRFVLVIDLASILFLFTLFILSNSVLLYSYYYISETSSYTRFLACLLAFLVSMFGLVLRGGLLSFFVFWDLLGFSSFFLVIWYRNRASVAGGLITGLLNRAGDCLFLVLIGLALGFRSLSFTLLVVIVLVSFTKSAQFPFSSWLPAAIAAPTPVSSLVHSSTLVTAGVYLLYRFLPPSSALLVSAGIATTLIAGLGAFLEVDLKKVVAMSTMSQLGLIFTSLGLGLKSLTFLHLNLHASSKALLFMAIGLLIHSNYGSQESRHSGSWVTSSFLIPFSVTVSCFSICGMTCLRGWVSKDYILSGFYSTSHSNFLLTSFLIGVILTVSYSSRLVWSWRGYAASFTSLQPRLPLPFLLKVSLIRVFFLVVVQGISINVKSYPLFAVLSSWAFVALVSAISLGLLLSAVTNPLLSCSFSAYKGLSLCTYYTSSYSVVLSNVVPVQTLFSSGSGISLIPSLFTIFSGPGLYLVRSCVLLIVILIV